MTTRKEVGLVDEMSQVLSVHAPFANKNPSANRVCHGIDALGALASFDEYDSNCQYDQDELN
jgi:hypothetical protein